MKRLLHHYQIRADPAQLSRTTEKINCLSLPTRSVPLIFLLTFRLFISHTICQQRTYAKIAEHSKIE